MSLKDFFVDALTAALDLGVGTPDDVVRHVTPDVLAQHLPRPLWARLLTACLGAPKVDAQLVVETIGVPNLCEHVPGHVIWACIAEIGARSLGQAVAAPAIVAAPPRVPLTAPPPEAAPQPMRATSSAPIPGPAIPAPAPVNQPLADLISELEQDDRPAVASRPRTPTSPRFRQSNTGLQRPLGTSGARRPQAVAARPIARRGATEVEQETETAIDSGNDWRNREPLAVDDSQLVDWQTENGTSPPPTADDDFGDIGRKR